MLDIILKLLGVIVFIAGIFYSVFSFINSYGGTIYKNEKMKSIVVDNPYSFRWFIYKLYLRIYPEQHDDFLDRAIGKAPIKMTGMIDRKHIKYTANYIDLNVNFVKNINKYQNTQQFLWKYSMAIVSAFCFLFFYISSLFVKNPYLKDEMMYLILTIIMLIIWFLSVHYLSNKILLGRKDYDHFFNGRRLRISKGKIYDLERNTTDGPFPPIKEFEKIESKFYDIYFMVFDGSNSYYKNMKEEFVKIPKAYYRISGDADVDDVIKQLEIELKQAIIDTSN